MNGVITPDLDRLVARWNAMEMTRAAPAPPVEVRAFESSLGVTLPREFRHYVATLNGVEDYEIDDEFFSFWRLDRIRDEPDHIELTENGVLIPFADYCIGAIVYLLKIDDVGEDAGIVVRCGNLHFPVASSFIEFVKRYLEAPSELHRDAIFVSSIEDIDQRLLPGT